MEKETLTCITCSATWKRTKARGRKPKLCPACLLEQTSSENNEEDQDDSLEEVPLEPEEAPPVTLYKPGSKWQCSSCGAKIKIGVGINEPPMHKCPKRANRVLQLNLI